MEKEVEQLCIMSYKQWCTWSCPNLGAGKTLGLALQQEVHRTA